MNNLTQNHRTSREQIDYLLSSRAVRERCHAILELARQGELNHFTVDDRKIPAVADFVLEVTKRDYPDLNIPYHSRWRHFDVGGIDRTGALDEALRNASPLERATAKLDLAIVSVLLDAGAGDAWHFVEPTTGGRYTRSEGLAVVSFHLFMSGALSSDPANPYRVDSAGLRRLSRDDLAAAFQVSEYNPLLGLDGRLALLRSLADALERSPDLFGASPARPGGLAAALTRGGKTVVPAPDVLKAVLVGFGPIWPARISLEGVNLGDTWPHVKLGGRAIEENLVPFHKLSQWLSYSLLEPLEEMGVQITRMDELTGLAEYRNGGLFVDLGVIVPRDPKLLTTPVPPSHEAIIEWRALTVALLDEVAIQVRTKLGRSAEEFPLARVLQGGTWTAGRIAAKERRPGGGPPISIVSDGTVF
ncbi:MAG: hypothetical protein RL417_1063 [Pseudomonadota bacterium]|jgi:hypothetical protein